MKVRLRAFREADSGPLFTWLDDREYRLASGAFEFVSPREHEVWFESVLRGDPSKVSLAVDSDGELVGLVQLVSINRRYGTAELRIRMAPQHRGQGYGHQALSLLCQHAFSDLNLNRIYLTVRSDNQAAIACYLKVGFQEEGRLRQHAFIDGEYRDMVAMGLLRNELR